MASLPMVEHLEPLEEGESCSSPGGPVLPVDQLRPKRPEAALRDGVIVAIPGATHRAPDPVSGENGLISPRRVLAAAVRVMHQVPRERTAALQGHRERAQGAL